MRSSLFALLLGISLPVAAWAQLAQLQQANRLEVSGRFKEAAATLNRALREPGLSEDARGKLEFELDRLTRIKKDFPLTKMALFAELKQSVRNLTEAEFNNWVKDGRFDNREIDGEKYFMTSSVSNLFFRYPDLTPRRLPPKDTTALEKQRWETCVAIKKAAMAEDKPYVLPKRFDVTMTVKANASAAPDGETIRAWLPVPREYPFQSDFELLSSSSAIRHADAKDTSLRAVYLEQTVRSNQPTEFKLEYAYTTHGVWFDLRPGNVKPSNPADPPLTQFLGEAPHIVFTPEMRALSQRIAGTETNPCVKAKKFYDWIADHIQDSYAIEYSTIRNISDYCRAHGYGDCGQEALLFMTLCRLNGIPARWQSGWNTFPGAKSIHDWSEVYLAPYGWVPVDPYMGIFAMRYSPSLTPEQRRELRDFYFGGLDQYRMVANSDHNQELTPAKKTMRSDDVDFQRGELEWGSHNIYFDQFSYSLTLKEVKGTTVE